MSDVVGVDAAGRMGWVAVALRDGRLLSMALHPSLAEVVASYPEARAIGVDIPIGHDDPEGTRAGGRRQCDVAAREYLSPARRASVFLVPPPAAFAEASAEAATELCRRRGWIAPSAQVWALRQRIREAAEQARDPRVYEVHPEVSFQALNEGRPLAEAKTTWAGLFERLELLHAAKLRPGRSVGGVGRADPNDVLDATVAAWSAARVARGEAASLPVAPPPDPTTGRPVAIWY